MPGPRICGGVLLTTLVLTIGLVGREPCCGLWTLEARLGRKLSEVDHGAHPDQSSGKCKGKPDPAQQLGGPILDAICGRIGRPGAKFLVFGLGRASQFWFSNTAGQVTFLENQQDLVKLQSEEVKRRTHIVRYTTEMSHYQAILRDKAKLSEFLTSLPQDVRDTRWDVILVDAPMGESARKKHPGRMQSMFAARELAHGGTVIFVDDYQRTVEKASAAVLLAPASEASVAYPNGHGGQIAMFVMPAGGPGPYEPPPSPLSVLDIRLRAPQDHEVPDQSFTSPRLVPKQIGTWTTSTTCKGDPSQKQQLRGHILDAICRRIGRSGTNFLVFGLGRDSSFWFSNAGGKIMFLENHKDLVKFQSQEIRQRTHLVRYTTQISRYKTILQDEAKLRELLESLPAAVRKTRWDVILVDSPMGDSMAKEQPGRMQSIYAARKLAHAGTVIFVDDYERTVEQASAAALLQPFAAGSFVFSNGHAGKTAMFVIGAER